MCCKIAITYASLLSVRFGRARGRHWRWAVGCNVRRRDRGNRGCGLQPLQPLGVADALGLELVFSCFLRSPRVRQRTQNLGHVAFDLRRPSLRVPGRR